jgi:hypothetical protein
VVYGPDEFGQYAFFPTATDIPDSSTDSFLGLRYAVGANTFYGFAQFAGSDLERYGFETTPNTAIDASAAIAQIPELSTWAMMTLGFIGAFLVAARRRSIASPDAEGDAGSARGAAGSASAGLGYDRS